MGEYGCIDYIEDRLEKGQSENVEREYDKGNLIKNLDYEEVLKIKMEHDIIESIRESNLTNTPMFISKIYSESIGDNNTYKRITLAFENIRHNKYNQNDINKINNLYKTIQVKSQTRNKRRRYYLKERATSVIKILQKL